MKNGGETDEILEKVKEMKKINTQKNQKNLRKNK